MPYATTYRSKILGHCIAGLCDFLVTGFRSRLPHSFADLSGMVGWVDPVHGVAESELKYKRLCVEICLLTNAKRVASVRSETYCNLFSLSVDHFNAVLTRYPAMRHTMQTVAAQRLDGIGRDPSVVFGDRDAATDSATDCDWQDEVY